MLTIPFDAVRRAFGDETIRRGRDYAAQGRVSGVTLRQYGASTLLSADVQGSGRSVYATTVSVTVAPNEVRIAGDCSCPVGDDCKHAVAVLFSEAKAEADDALPTLSPVRPVPAGPPAWARDLGTVLGDLEERRTGGGTQVPLALQIDYRSLESRWSAAGFALLVRPLKRGKSGAWVKTGASWYDLQTMRYRHEHDPAQVEVLLDMASAFLRGYGQQNPNLLDLGPMVWSLLHRARAAGIELVPDGGLSEVRIDPEPVRVRADLTAAGGDLTVRIGLDHDGLWWPNDDGQVAVVGEPAHGVALVRRVAQMRTLVLAPLAEPLPASLQRRLAARTPLLVPAEERAQFEAEYLPRLRRQLPTASDDASVVLPEIEPPRLRLTVGWEPGPAVATSWSWVYGEGEQTRVYPLDTSEDPAHLRDWESEQTILAALVLPEAADAALREENGDVSVRARWSDRRLVQMVEEILPAVEEAARGGAFEVVESGERIDIRAAKQGPRVSFTTGPGDDGDGHGGGFADTEGAGHDWLDLAIAITVDDEPVPLAAVLSALTSGNELIFTESGRHVRADHPAFAQLAELVAAAEQIVDQPAEGLRVGRYDLALWAELDALGVIGEQARAWARSARALAEFDGLPELTVPGLASTPRPYQSEGISWLGFLWASGLGGILADDMGLGKTLQTLALISHAREHGAGPFLVIAPTSVIGTWVAEAARHTPGLVARAVTASAARREESLAEVYAGADLVVTSYTLFRLEAEEYRELAWGGLILDEAHTVKNHQGKTYHEVRRLEVPFRLAVTGTPFENRLMELWALLSIVAPGLYPWPKRFTEQVVRPVELRGDEQALARFRRRIRPFLLRRTKELVADDLPPKQEQVLEITLNPRHRRIYDTHLQRERQTVLGLVDDFQRNRIAIFGALTRLRQLSLDPALVDPKHDKVGSAKLDALVEQLHEITAEGHRALVFSQFTTYLGRVRERLEREGIATSYLDGRTRNRVAVIDGFKTGNQPVFLISLKAGGSGLTLTEADYVFVLDPWWNPAVEAQAIDRAHRIGQPKHVMAYRMVSVGTIEEKVMALKESKAALFAEVMDGDGAMAKSLDADDVRSLFEE